MTLQISQQLNQNLPTCLKALRKPEARHVGVLFGEVQSTVYSKPKDPLARKSLPRHSQSRTVSRVNRLKVWGDVTAEGHHVKGRLEKFSRPVVFNRPGSPADSRTSLPTGFSCQSPARSKRLRLSRNVLRGQTPAEPTGFSGQRAGSRSSEKRYVPVHMRERRSVGE